MFILLFVVPAIVFIIALIITKDPIAILFSIAAFLLMLLAAGACASSVSEEDIRLVDIISDTELVELDDNIYVVEVWDEKKNDVKYQYLCQNAQFKEKTYKDKDEIEIVYEKGVKPHAVEYKREWTTDFAKFVFCSPPQNKTVIYLPSTSNLCVSWPN